MFLIISAESVWLWLRLGLGGRAVECVVVGNKCLEVVNKFCYLSDTISVCRIVVKSIVY